LVNSNSIPYDAICQSYYPIYHGPLTAAQAAASNPGNQPVEQSVLTMAATSLGKPIFLIEAGEHYENGFDSNDPWYPATVAGQRQFLIDVDTVLKGLPSRLGMGMDYWDAEGEHRGARRRLYQRRRCSEWYLCLEWPDTV
jgi:arabinogalactan endo-1,4-beta-galactosidase